MRKRAWLVAAGAAVLLGPAVAVVFRTASSSEIAPRLTHTVTRGDLLVTVTERGTLESSRNTEIKCRVRGENRVIWVMEPGTEVEPGDELVRLDTLHIEEAISERTKFAHRSRSLAERSKADVARAELAISEYLEGRYRVKLMTLEKDLAIAESKLRTAQDALAHAEKVSERGHVSKLQVKERKLSVSRAGLHVEVKKGEIEDLKQFTRKEELETLKGNLAAARARYEADAERALADEQRRNRALEELANCVIRADQSGVVIYPSAAAWKNAPDVTEGATVHKDQVLLIMPDLLNMQVNVGIHESVIDRVKPGLSARVTLPGKVLDGEVTSVASVTRPGGWWTGNVVKFDTLVRLPSTPGLRSGMSAQVELVLARHEDVLTVPVAAVLETEGGHCCWVKTTSGARRRRLELGDSNDLFIVVKEGLAEGDQVLLNPQAFNSRS